MKGLILFRSKYGATKRYAKWLSEKIGFDVLDVNEADIGALNEYDALIFGGGIYASAIAGFSFIKRNITVLKEKVLLVFCVGASPYDQDELSAITAHNLKQELAGIPCFYCRGAFNLEKMHFIDRTLCKILRRFILRKKPETLLIWEKALIDAGDKDCDWTDEKYLEPIMEFLKSARLNR